MEEFGGATWRVTWTYIDAPDLSNKITLQSQLNSISSVTWHTFLSGQPSFSYQVTVTLTYIWRQIKKQIDLPRALMRSASSRLKHPHSLINFVQIRLLLARKNRFIHYYSTLSREGNCFKLNPSLLRAVALMFLQ